MTYDTWFEGRKKFVKRRFETHIRSHKTQDLADQDGTSEVFGRNS